MRPVSLVLSCVLLLSAGKIALRGTHVDLIPMNMSKLADFLRIDSTSAPTQLTANSPAFDGFAPMELTAPMAVVTCVLYYGRNTVLDTYRASFTYVFNNATDIFLPDSLLYMPQVGAGLVTTQSLNTSPGAASPLTGWVSILTLGGALQYYAVTGGSIGKPFPGLRAQSTLNCLDQLQLSSTWARILGLCVREYTITHEAYGQEAMERGLQCAYWGLLRSCLISDTNDTLMSAFGARSSSDANIAADFAVALETILLLFQWGNLREAMWDQPMKEILEMIEEEDIEIEEVRAPTREDHRLAVKEIAKMTMEEVILWSTFNIPESNILPDAIMYLEKVRDAAEARISPNNRPKPRLNHLLKVRENRSELGGLDLPPINQNFRHVSATHLKELGLELSCKLMLFAVALFRLAYGV